MHSILKQITSLRRGNTVYGPAPHKPILLLAVLESFEFGEIRDNWIEINETLLTRFYDLWKLLVKTGNTPNFSLPFYHLSHEKGELWKLIMMPGMSIPTTKSNSIKSFSALKTTALGAKLSAEFYYDITDAQTREALRKALLNAYFPDYSEKSIISATRYSQEIEKQILYDPAENYARRVTKQIERETIEAREEELILRSHIFRKAVLEVYDKQCAVSGLKIDPIKQTILIDACHIVPFSQTYDDTIRNGISLSPTFHRAFDNGLIAIDADYRLLVHPKLKDYNPAAGIRQYEHKTIFLPKEELFYPSLKRLAEHRVRFGY
ncbi:MAG TPA: HNH endonuclease [Paludibacter sp.]